jgi:hypothetical protein
VVVLLGVGHSPPICSFCSVGLCCSCARRSVRVLVLFIFVLLLFCFLVCFVLLVCDSWRSTSVRVFLRCGDG